MDLIYLLKRKCLVICLLVLHLYFVVSNNTFTIIGLFPINATSAKESEDLKLTISNLKQQYVYNSSIVIHMYNKSNKDDIAMKIMLEKFAQPNHLTAIIGPGRKKDIYNVNHFLTTIPDKVLQLVYNPVIDDDHKKYFHNSAPSVSQVVDVLVDVLAKIKWNYIAIMKDATEFSMLATELFKKKAKINKICIGLEKEILRNEVQILKDIESADITGIVVLGKKDTIRSVSRNVDPKKFQFIFVCNENLDFENTKQELPNHSLQITFNGFEKKINNDTFSYMNDAVHMALNWFSICQNLSNCRDLQQKEIIRGSLNIYQKQNDKQIQIDIHKTEQNVINFKESFCNKECKNCIIDKMPNIYTLKNGTYYIVLIIPAYKHSKENEPLKCSQSDNTKNIIELIDAARFAIKTSLNPDLGLIIIDSCSQPLILTQLLVEISYTNILGVIGGYYSMTTIPAAEILTSLQRPLITYGAESHALSDRNRFPYVLRTVSSNEEKCKAIILLCKKMKWKAINVIYNRESFGISAQSLLLKFAKENGICIVNNIQIELGAFGFQTHLNQIRKTSTVKIVVIFLLRDSYKRWLSILNEDQELNEFLFIDAYGQRDKDVRLILKNNYKNQMIVRINSLTNQEFLHYYENLTKPDIEKNPWAKRLIETIDQCRFEGSFNIAFERKCKYQLPVDSVSTYHDYVIKSIYALINGTICVFKKLCEFNIEQVSQEIRKVKLNISGKEQRLFDDIGNSQFNLYSLLRVKNLYPFQYEKVAAYENGTWKGVQLNEYSFFTSTCDGSCKVCPTEPYKRSETAAIVFTSIDVILALIIIIITGIFIWIKLIKNRSSS